MILHRQHGGAGLLCVGSGNDCIHVITGEKRRHLRRPQLRVGLDAREREYITFCDDDQLWQGALKMLLQLVEDNRADIVQAVAGAAAPAPGRHFLPSRRTFAGSPRRSRSRAGGYGAFWRTAPAAFVWNAPNTHGAG